jgi:transmembrane sensor
VGPLVIEDLGTVFSVLRLSEYQFEVAVEEGRVAVLCQDSRAELGGGQRRIFACGEPSKQVMTATPLPAKTGTAERPRSPRAGAAALASRGGSRVVSPSEGGAEREPGVAGGAGPSALSGEGGLQPGTPQVFPVAPLPQAAPAWQVLAERGQYREAYASLRSERATPVRDETHELLLAADTARLSGHSGEAVPYLRRILIQHSDDPRAHLVAFTLGRVLLDELGRPAEAAEAFARARVRRTPLAEDALAREIEARARAGDARRAHALAIEYQRNYPQGRRMRAVAKFGGLGR